MPMSATNPGAFDKWLGSGDFTIDGGRIPTASEITHLGNQPGDRLLFGMPITGLQRLSDARKAGLIDAFGSPIEQPPTQTVPAPIPQPEPQPTAVNKTGSSDYRHGGTTPKKKKEEQRGGSVRRALLLSGGGGKLG